MKFAAQPCKSCPYRRDAPLRLWHRSEFEKLLHHDADAVNGNVFLCHRYRDRTPCEDDEMCAGWVLDRRRRGIPSMRLRLRLMIRPDLVSSFEAVNADGIDLYDSIEEMCQANGLP